MGATYVTDEETGRHVSRGKLDPGGISHEPQWSDTWLADPPGPRYRWCEHPNCDQQQYETK